MPSRVQSLAADVSRPPRLSQLDHRRATRCGVHQIEGGFDNGSLTLTIEGSTERPAHRMTSDDRTRQFHQLGYVLECAYEYGDGGDPRFLETSCDVSDRHVADRSDGDQEEYLDTVGLESIDPVRKCLFAQASLGGCSGEGVHR